MVPRLPHIDADANHFSAKQPSYHAHNHGTFTMPCSNTLGPCSLMQPHSDAPPKASLN